MEAHGLLSVDSLTHKRSPIPFKGVSVDARIEDFCSNVIVVQTFRNDTNTSVEAVYRFPLHERSAINRFVAYIDSKKLVGQIQTSEKAAQTYDDAISQGKGAYLLQKKERGIYEMNVGALPPGKEVKIEISYISDLDFEGNDIVFEIPTSVAPASSSLSTSGSQLLEANYAFTLSLNVNMTRTIQSLHCSNYKLHNLDSVIGSKSGSLTMEPGSRMGSPFRLLIGLADIQTPSVRTEVLSEGTEHTCAIMVNFCPEIKSQKPTETEIIFVLDRSGSMSGARIAAAKKALMGALDMIAQEMAKRPIYFNVFGFGSRWTKMFDQSEIANENSVTTARNHFENVDADLGGTDLLPVLCQIKDSEVHPGRPRNIILLTDGEVGNISTVIWLVQQLAASSRVFPFGIGPDVSRTLVSGMARASGTRPEFVSTEELDSNNTLSELLQKVGRQITRSLQPAVLNVKMDWGGLSVKHQSPAVLPPLWHQEAYVAFALCNVKDFNPEKVYSLKLSGVTQEGEKVEFNIDAKMGDLSSTNLIHSTVARAVIFDLDNADRQFDIPTIVELSKKYTLVSKHTSFVAVEDRAEAVQQTMKLVNVPQPSPGTSPTSSFAASVIPSRALHIPMAVTGAVSWRRDSIKYKRNEVFVDFLDQITATISSSGDVIRATVETSLALKCFLSGMPELKMKINVPGIDWYNIGKPGGPEILLHQCARVSQLTEGVIHCIPPDGEFQLMKCVVQENYSIPFKVVSSFYKASPTSLEITLYVKATYAERNTTDVTITIPLPVDSTEHICKSRSEWRYVPENEEIRWRIRNFRGCQTEKISLVINYAQEFFLDNSKEISLKFSGSICVSGGSLPYLRIVEKTGYKAEMWMRNHTQGTLNYRWGLPK